MIHLESVKTRVIESSELDQRHLLRPLLLFMGSQSEGRIRSLWNLVVTLMDADVQSVTEGVKLAKTEDYRHMCGLHTNPQNLTFNSIVSRIIASKQVADLVPGLWEYARYLASSQGATYFHLQPIPEYSLRVRSSRDWRIMPGHLRPQRPQVPELYPYISGVPTAEHEMLMAVDAIVPKGLPNAVRSDVCQDMIVAILSGEVTMENLKGDLKKYLGQFWRMFPDKYGPISLDGVVPGTDDFRLIDTISNKTRSA